jgi:hypothetical protein
MHVYPTRVRLLHSRGQYAGTGLDATLRRSAAERGELLQSGWIFHGPGCNTSMGNLLELSKTTIFSSAAESVVVTMDIDLTRVILLHSCRQYASTG